MTPPDPAVTILRLEELITPDLHEHLDPQNRAAVVGWGWFFLIRDQISAVLLLHREQRCAAAAPNRRAAVEHTMTLLWLADEGDSVVDVFNRGLQQDQIQLANMLRAADMTHTMQSDAYAVLEATVATDIPPHPDERLRKIDHLFRAYESHTLRAYYQVESRFAHPSLTGAQLYFRDQENGFQISQESLFPEAVPCQLFSLHVLYDAMLAFNGLLLGTPWSETLASVADKHDLSAQPIRRR
ncbi:hypothetical protein ABIA33_003386 [Streptacidiphilus sp. MAP12-16]|uniref:DUF5677 domain-containing protein n=1 Tax=Streptacidiphilus sp. MAP12-16 TaxID=3156300 RepID=UPI0035128FD3